MQLSPHFTLAEFCASAKAAEWNVSNDPPASLYPVLRRTAEGMEDVRALLGGEPIVPSSVYRSEIVNRLVGGEPDGQHPKGEACDFAAPHFGTPRQVYEAIRDSDIEFDQLILEQTWVHISFIRRARRQAFVAKGVTA